ncbi:hypothetical protein KPP03845_107074 [Streptomyces xanthophaeus]|nr:hypothetical protein KPP03845_107074 [Streptomyces xanthophaeus]
MQLRIHAWACSVMAAALIPAAASAPPAAPRPHVTADTLPGTIGLDAALRDPHGSVTVGLIGLAAALPGLIADDPLRCNPSEETDPYGAQLFDLTRW